MIYAGRDTRRLTMDHALISFAKTLPPDVSASPLAQPSPNLTVHFAGPRLRQNDKAYGSQTPSKERRRILNCKVSPGARLAVCHVPQSSWLSLYRASCVREV